MDRKKENERNEQWTQTAPATPDAWHVCDTVIWNSTERTCVCSPLSLSPQLSLQSLASLFQFILFLADWLVMLFYLFVEET